MPRTNTRPSVKNQKEINALQPEQDEYRATVGGVDCLYVKVSPNGAKKYVTSLTVSKRIQLPSGQARQKSKTHGLTSQFTLPDIKRIHYQYYESFKRGEDPREEAIRETSDLERTSQLNRPIIELSIERLERRLTRGEIKDGYNDRLYTKKIEDIIGRVSFQEFSQAHADQLAIAYPPTEQWSTADKIKKLITKVYNTLPSDARFDLRKDILHYLDNAFGRIRQKARGDQLVSPNEIGEAWQRMVQAKVNPIFKDAWVFMLLTGERKTAILRALRDNVTYDRGFPKNIFLETKGDRDGEGKNLIPAYGVLTLLIHRLHQQSEARSSRYLFPSQRGYEGSLTSIKPLIKEIGGLGDQEILSNPHNLRRTVANLARNILGSTAIADEHLLHNKKHMKGSSKNYFDSNAEAFAETRQQSFKLIYRHLDDLVLASGEFRHIDHGISDKLDEKESEIGERYICRDYLSVCGLDCYFNRGEKRIGFGIFQGSDDFLESAKIWSPVASFCAGTDKFVFLKDRPLLKTKLIDEWVNFGIEDIRNPDNEIS